MQNIELNALPVYDDRSIKTKIRTYGNKVYNFCSLNVPEDGAECESLLSFILILYLMIKINITLKYILTIVVIKL